MRGLAGGAFDFLVTAVPDQQDVVVLGGEAPGLVVHLGDQRAGRIDGPQATALRFLADGRGDAVRGENNHRPLRHAVRLCHEDRAARFQFPDHVRVVHDLPAHVDGGSVALKGHLDCLHGPVDARAVTAGLGEQYSSGSHGHVPYGR